MYRNLLVIVVVLLILTSTKESNASLFRKLADNPLANLTQIPPSPSPASSINLCEPSSNRCPDKNVSACILHTGNGPQGSFLLVQNDGESALKVNITTLPVDTTFKPLKEEIELSKHQAKKINISSNVEGIQSIVLNAGSGNCVIPMGSLAPPVNNNYMFPYATYATPIHGAYLLLFTVMIIGGACACCSCGKRGRHLDGVPYQELEMGQQPEPLSATNVETSGGWDQGWDDDWEEEKAVKSPGHDRVGNGRTNEITPKSSNGDGWGNDWDD